MTTEALVPISDGAITPELVDYDPTQSIVPTSDTPKSLQQADPFYGAGDLALSPERVALLQKPFEANALEILPTGEVYLPQVDYRRRLNEALGVGQWALRPLNPPSRQGKTVVQEYGLYAFGRFVSSAFGEADYIENNPRSSWGTALESAKSNALMRCCKDLGVNLECWDRDFTENWKRQFAYRDRNDDNKWKKKNNVAGSADAGAPSTSNDVPQPERVAPTSYASSNSTAETPASAVSTNASNGNKKQEVRIVSAGKTWKYQGTANGMYADDQGQKWKGVGDVCATLNDAVAHYEAKGFPVPLILEYKVEKDGKYTNRVVLSAEVVA